ncbi:hypothetical protein BGAL_0371g00020 [Botrytis galanthina]|uniref:Uncharacterized protein n=1 Tax=Botrytis galanthina TaxID=278940 RepID=A0A4S8QP20_9HELO|nr:hypothetical protein BGAL_0371g00020 [Botrytis galanthina]
MSSRPSPYAKGPEDLTPPRHPAAFENSSLDNKKADTFPREHDRKNVNPARNKIPRVPMPDATSSSSNGTTEPGVHDHERDNGHSKGRDLITSLLGRREAHQSTGNHGEEDGKGKKKAKKIKKVVRIGKTHTHFDGHGSSVHNGGNDVEMEKNGDLKYRAKIFTKVLQNNL